MSDQKSPLVTVYLVNHNYGRYLQQAVDSIFDQTMQNFELVIIDDGSTDGSRDLIEQYTDRDRTMLIFQHNKGLNVTNNIALRAATGKYIIRLDADDYLDPHALQMLSDVLERDSDIALVFPDYYEVDTDGNVEKIVRRHDFEKVTVLDRPAHGACTMIRTDVLRELGGYDEEYRCQDGYDIWVRLFKLWRVKNVNLPLFYYRRHEQNLTRDEARLLTTRARILAKQRDVKKERLDTIAVVPVRGNTIDPHSIALRELNSKPLIDWTIDAAMESERISSILVTTPDEKILQHVGERYGDHVQLVMRPVQMARVNSHLEDTALHALDHYEELKGKDPDAVMTLYVESPFRLPRHIDSAIDSLELFETDSVIAVRPDLDTIFQHNGSGLHPLLKSSMLRLEADATYREVGNMQVHKVPFLRQEKKKYGGRIGHIVMDEKYCFSILSEWDWHVAELLVQSPFLEELQAEYRKVKLA